MTNQNEGKRTTALGTRWHAPWPSREIQVNAPGVPRLECNDVPTQVEGDACTPGQRVANEGMMDINYP